MVILRKNGRQKSPKNHQKKSPKISKKRHQVKFATFLIFILKLFVNLWNHENSRFVQVIHYILPRLPGFSIPWYPFLVGGIPLCTIPAFGWDAKRALFKMFRRPDQKYILVFSVKKHPLIIFFVKYTLSKNGNIFKEYIKRNTQLWMHWLLVLDLCQAWNRLQQSGLSSRVSQVAIF